MNIHHRNAILICSTLALAASFAVVIRQSGAGTRARVEAPREQACVLFKPESAGAATTPNGDTDRQALDRRTDGEPSSGLFSAAPGTLLAFDLLNTGSSVISSHEGAVLQSLEVELRGELELEVLARRGDEMALAIRLPHSKVEQRVAGEVQGAEASAALEASLARPVLVRARNDGTTLGFRFDPQAQPDERNRVRALWGALMPVAPQPLNENWTAVQQDAMGAVRCAYRLVSADEARVEIERSSRECLERDPSHPAPTLSGTARVGIDRALGWFDSVIAEETAKIEVDVAGWTILSQQVARCTLTRVRRDGPRGIDWEQAWESVSGAADSGLIAERNHQRQLYDSLNGRTLDQLVDQLNALLAAGDLASPELVRLREQLGFFLSIDNAALARVAELVLDPRLSSELVATLIDCVGRAGTLEAQALLARWIADSDRAQALRTESVYALLEVKQPGTTVVAAVAGLLGEGIDPQLQGSALLTMGALANIGGTHTAAGSAAFQHVMQWKHSAEEAGRLPEWIEALGNCGSPQVVEALEPYLAHADASVRASAVHALRLVFTLEVSDLAAARGREDNSCLVRERAAEVLGARSDSHARAAIGFMLDNEPVAEVRQALILQLGCQAANDVAARALLEDAAATDPSAELRELAHQQLGAAPHG